MKALRNTLIIAVLAALGVAGVMLLTPDQNPEPAPAPAPRAQKTVAAPPAQRPATPSAPRAPAIPPMLAAVTPPEDEGVVHGEFTTDTDIMKQKLFKKEPKLAQFDFFREHVLPDSNMRNDYHELLADKAMLAQVRQDLLYSMESKDSMESNVKRLMEVDYLREAMNWKDHPDRKDVLSEVESIILEDSFNAQMPMSVKRSITASKLELYELLSNQDPARALALVDQARGTRLEKMLAYFADYNQRRLVKERELSLQAQSSLP